MKLTVLGSGSSVPHPRRSSSAYWLETDGGSLLLDCSASAIHRMAQENLDWANLDAIWISHFHLDHCGGLAPLLFGTKYAPQTQHRKKPLRIFGPKGIEDLIGAFGDANDYDLLNQPFPTETVEVGEGDNVEILGDLSARFFSTPHTPESHAIRLESAPGETLVFSSDTGYSEDLADFAAGVDKLLIECSFVKNKPVEKHLELSDVMRIAEIANPKTTMLTHFYPEWDDVDFAGEIAKYGDDRKVNETFDGLRLDVPG